MNDFHYGLSLLSTMFGIEMQEEDYEEIALIGWNLIGNKRVRLYRYNTCVTDCDEGVQLPCNLDELEAVTVPMEEWNYSTNDTPNGDTHSAWVESYIERRKGFRDPYYIPGKFIRYEKVGDMLYFDRPHGKINILYKGIIMDDNELPEITDKEALALATYCAYIIKYKEGIMTNNVHIIQLANALKQQWELRCDQARVDQYITQNEWDEILDAKFSHNRKQYNKSLKLYH